MCVRSIFLVQLQRNMTSNWELYKDLNACVTTHKALIIWSIRVRKEPVAFMVLLTPFKQYELFKYCNTKTPELQGIDIIKLQNNKTQILVTKNIFAKKAIYGWC